MAKELAAVLCDGSVEAAVACALAGQRYRVGVVHVGVEGTAASRRRQAAEGIAAHYGAQQVWAAYLPGAGEENDGTVQGKLLGAVGAIGLGLQVAARWKAAALYVPLRTGAGADELARGTEFVQIWGEMIQLPCGREGIEVVAPVLELEPWQVVELGIQVEAPLELTWSCETAGPVACGLCEGCKGREAAFLRAVKRDPLGVERR